MRAEVCDRESRVIQALASGREVDPDTRAHLSTCAICREAAATTRWMRTLSDTAGEVQALPDPALLWWKGQLLRRWEAERRAVAPIERMQSMELVAGILGGLIVVVWQWAELRRLFSRLNPADLTAWTATAGASPYLPVVLVGMALFGVMLFAGVHRLLAE